MSKRPRHTYRSHHIGRLRIHAAKILSRGFKFTIEPEWIQPATGAYRTDWRQDVFRWELFAEMPGGYPRIFHSWSRLTDFVKQSKQAGGFHVDKDNMIDAGPAINTFYSITART